MDQGSVTQMLTVGWAATTNALPCPVTNKSLFRSLTSNLALIFPYFLIADWRI